MRCAAVGKSTAGFSERSAGSIGGSFARVVSPATLSHSKVCPLNRRHSRSRSNHLDPRRSLAPEHVEEKLARWTGEPNSGFSPSNRDPLVGSRPRDLEANLAQPPTQVAATSADVAP